MLRLTIILIALCSSIQTCLAETFSVQILDKKTQLPVTDGVLFVTPKDSKTVNRKTEMEYSIVQKNRQFDPQLLVVPAGAKVSFPNEDSYKHHVYSFSPTKLFELKLYSDTRHSPVVFDKPGVAALGCNIHDGMSAFVVVTDEPFYALSDKDGWATVQDLKPGKYTWHIWHSKMNKPMRKKRRLSNRSKARP